LKSNTKALKAGMVPRPGLKTCVTLFHVGCTHAGQPGRSLPTMISIGTTLVGMHITPILSGAVRKRRNPSVR